ncbi:hypothetical protein TCAL_14685 [Tigriopus californicus]|uniref:FAD dependent oxidoreductase domain-containing protein n=1 Tax=Tigriopus californicus TaxID=6832 RepID=A0A553NQE0_TIGCA|nr:hypothetical protein TCAL_14685 [Tigriopus californicus]
MNSFDIVVVGGGMIGSSVAKYLAKTSNLSIALIGPVEENQEWCHGAWFDEGRSTKIFDNSPYWQDLAVKSIRRYREIETESGVGFFSESGYMYVTTSAAQNPKYTLRTAQTVHLTGNSCERVTQSMFTNDFPYLSLPEAAQQKIALDNSCELVNEVVSSLTEVNGTFQIGTKPGHVFTAAQIVLANGAYANFLPNIKVRNWDNGTKKLDLTLRTQTVAYLELEKNEVDSKLSNFPSMTTSYQDGLLDGSYILPPVEMPDGKWYIKLGHGDYFEHPIESLAEIEDWYNNHPQGDLEGVSELERYLKKILPNINFSSVHGGSCVTANTPGKLAPFIDEVSPGFFVAVGGSGHAAKSSDEIGRIAAHLVTKSEWTTNIPQKYMKALWKE